MVCSFSVTAGYLLRLIGTRRSNGFMDGTVSGNDVSNMNFFHRGHHFDTSITDIPES